MYKLMIVDDSNIIRNKISRCQSGGAFKIVAKARNGAQAVKAFETYSPDLITMDLTMPHMDGLEAIRHIIDIDPNVRILVVSALSDKATGIRALKLGAQGFLCKPFSDEDLVEALHEVMED
ncbi:MAG: response regulator [Gammaproteobacteria bacterium]|nr:MAG: response regulator [Gammaproteobacteria bacterium]